MSIGQERIMFINPDASGGGGGGGAQIRTPADKGGGGGRHLRTSLMYAPYVCMNLLPDCVPFQHSSDNNTYYVKIHCPFYVLCDGAELMNLKLPFKVTASRIN